eukprot:scaffold222483_cov20-Prasinocladus_malaysianus.AAC.2
MRYSIQDSFQQALEAVVLGLRPPARFKIDFSSLITEQFCRLQWQPDQHNIHCQATQCSALLAKETGHRRGMANIDYTL